MSEITSMPPKFGGNPGEPVPEVDPEDIKTLWALERDVEARHPGQLVATGADVAKHACKPGADIQAVGYRAGMLSFLNLFMGQQLTPWTKDGQFEDSVFRAAAKVPLQWMELGVPKEGFPFDVEEFFRLCRSNS